MRTTFHYPESPYERTYADVITKISRIDSLQNDLSYGAPLARASRAQGAPLLLEPEWAIDSEAMRARGIIVLVKSYYLVKNIETKQLYLVKARL